MGFRDRLTALAETVADEARERTTDAVQDAKGHATRGARWLAERDPSASARLKLMASDDARLSVEAFLVLLLDTMNADDDDDHAPTAKQVERAGRRRARRAAIDGSGPSVAAQVPDDRVLDGKPITGLSPKDAVLVLWRMRQLTDPDELPGTTKMRPLRAAQSGASGGSPSRWRRSSASAGR